jgi:hypothetical protein
VNSSITSITSAIVASQLDPRLSELFDHIRAASNCASVCSNRDSAPPPEVYEHAINFASLLTMQLREARSKDL